MSKNKARILTSPGESMPPTERPLLQVRDLAVHFAIRAQREGPKGAVPEGKDIAKSLLRALRPSRNVAIRAVDGVSFYVQRGETLGLVGESGCGKSTTGRALVRLEKMKAGKITLGDIDVHKARGAELQKVRRQVQMVFQDPYGSLNPRMTIGELVAEPLASLGVEKDKNKRQEKVAELLERVGLGANLASRFPHEFSGGQRQRIATARALAPNPALIIADEPVSALDVSVQAQIVNLFEELREALNLAMLFIAHDLAVVRHLSDRIAVMYFGRIVEVGASEALVNDPLHPYTRALLDAVPVPDPHAPIKETNDLGDIPSHLNPPRGCAFHPRCKEAVDRCLVEAPLLKIGKLERPVACHVTHGET